MTIRFRFFFLLSLLCFPVFAKGSGESGGVRRESASGPRAEAPEQTSPEQIRAYFFYEELCAGCRDDELRFISILREELPPPERTRYPHTFEIVNIYEIQGQVTYEQVTGELGLEWELLEPPLLVLGGRVFQGYDSIRANLRETYLAAAEALYTGNPR